MNSGLWSRRCSASGKKVALDRGSPWCMAFLLLLFLGGGCMYVSVVFVLFFHLAHLDALEIEPR